MIKATFDAFSSMSSPRSIANKRGRKVAEIYGNDPKLNKDDGVQEELVKTE